MSDATGYRTNTGNIIVTGEPLVKLLKNIETVANMYPGRLVAKGTTDFDIKVADGVLAKPIGWLAYEDAPPTFKPATIDTIYVVSDKTRIARGGNFVIRAHMPKYWYATQGDVMLSWVDGQVVPGEMIGGQPFLKIPFTKKNGESDTNIDLVAGMVVSGCKCLVVTAASGTIDVGLLSSEAGGDADGFLDGMDTTTAGLISEAITFTNGTNNHYIAAATDVTRGELLHAQLASHTKADFIGVDASQHEDGSIFAVAYTVAAAVSVVYNTGNVASAGYILIGMENPGIMPVGFAEETVDSSAAAKEIMVRSTL